MFWLNFYSMVRQQLGYEESRDYFSARLLDLLIEEDFFDELRDIIKDSKVCIIGADETLERNENVSRCEKEGYVIIASDGSALLAKEKGVNVDIIFTDLDGLKEKVLDFRESLKVIHAHGDNVNLIYTLGRQREAVGTCQVYPIGKLKVLGGFTDGDRAVSASAFLGAREIRLISMNFNIASSFYSKPFSKGNPWKREKLGIGNRIVNTLKQMGYNILSEF
jgi:uncharacterized Rossmann fold enzyme